MRWNGLQKAPLAGAFFVLWASISIGSVLAAPQTVEVRRVIDGDSLQLESGKQVRLIGINTPEMVGPDDQPEPLAIIARDTLQRMIGARPVRLTPDQEKQDRHRRLLRYVETLDGRDVQERLLTEGLGFLVAIPPNLSRLHRYLDAQQNARSAGRGVWGLDAFAPLRADDIRKDDPLRGFKQVRGKISRYNASKRYYYFRMSTGFELKVPRAYWVYFDVAPEALLGKTLTARGWINRGKYRLQMRVAHPAMIDFE